MSSMGRIVQYAIGILAIGTGCWGLAAEQPAKPAAAAEYLNDFEKAALGEVPEDLMVLAGDFAVREEQGNRFLELPGTPLETFGLFVAPDNDANTACGARIFASRTGRRFPEFGVGLSGAGGYRLWLMPAVGELQLIKGDEVQARIPYKWTSGTWTVFRLQLRKMPEDQWRVEAKAWEHGQPEPTQWMIQIDEPGTPPKGPASVWGIPYSEKPIRFDDLVVRTSF